MFAHPGEAFAAIDGTVGLGFKRDAGFTAAVGADRGEVFPGSAGGVLAGVTAGFAALRLVLETALGVKLLLAGRKNELISALFAHQDLVFVHVFYPLFEKKILRSAFAGFAGKELPCDLAANPPHSVVHGLWGLAHGSGNFPA